MGIPGWRIAFYLVRLLSVIVSILVGLFAKDPHVIDSNGNAKQHASRKPFRSEIKDLINEAKSVMRIPTFQILIAQGVSGSFPWSSLSFAGLSSLVFPTRKQHSFGHFLLWLHQLAHFLEERWGISDESILDSSYSLDPTIYVLHLIIFIKKLSHCSKFYMFIYFKCKVQSFNVIGRKGEKSYRNEVKLTSVERSSSQPTTEYRVAEQGRWC